MNKDDLKAYSVLVGDGSGCIFQPMTDDYTYILTAKHLFLYEEDKGRGKEKFQLVDGTKIVIKRCVKTLTGWNEVPINFTLIEGETYFPHNNKEVDAAILKITPAIVGYDKICTSNQNKIKKETFLCGFPDNFRKNGAGDRYTDFKIERIISSGNETINAQVDTALNQNNISGTSGGGILYIDNDYINIIGVQSKMATETNYQAGQVAFVPVSYFEDIIADSECSGKLSKLYPPYLKSFDFLLDDCFSLEVDSIDETKIADTRTMLRNKAYEITQSAVTPIGIKELFNDRLLICKSDTSCLTHKKVWISWLEFLVIFNIAKNEDVDNEILSNIFNSYRLKYANVDDWTSIFKTDLLTSDYVGLKENSTVIVNTRNAPTRTRNLLVRKGTMPNNIGKVYDKRGFKADIGIDPVASFCFVHLDYFKSQCIVDKLSEYENLNENELLEKLKKEYNELFS